MNFVSYNDRIESLLQQDVINWDSVAHELMDEREKHQIDSFPHQPSWAISIDDFNPVVFIKKTMVFFQEIDLVKAATVVALPIIASFSVVFLFTTSSNLFFSLALCSVCLISSSMIARKIEESKKFSQEYEMIWNIIFSVDKRWNQYCCNTQRSGTEHMGPLVKDVKDVKDGHFHWKTNYDRKSAEQSLHFHEMLAEIVYPPVSG
ncbi:MAG: hypothetical protein HW387_1799 [Parachlamydiales bacterium]|nr:hypothetical protein [Parachlamydiales bacterium]